MDWYDGNPSRFHGSMAGCLPNPANGCLAPAAKPPYQSSHDWLTETLRGERRAGRIHVIGALGFSAQCGRASGDL
jgi:hypothetical protein